MHDLSRRWFGRLPTFDTEDGATVVEPPGRGPGHWAGACSVLKDGDVYYLYYRFRRPRGVGPDRGYECHIAESSDGVHFSDIWRMEKAALETTSMERACLVRTLGGKYRLYVSYVDPADGRWRIDLMEAESCGGFDPASRTPCLAADACGCEGVKDPWVFLLGGVWHMILSYAMPTKTATQDERTQMHASHDVYNTGITKSATALATSPDGVRWKWEGDIFSPPETGWDCYCRRISGLVWTPPVWTALYDGSASVEQNYEERTGIAISTGLRRFSSACPRGPVFGTHHGPGGVRYADPVQTGSACRFYYEYTREDGAHELRVSVVENTGT